MNLWLGALLAVSVWSLAGPFLEPASRQSREGLDKYRQGDFVGAAERLEIARGLDPSPRSQFNLGTAAYRGQNLKGAAEAFQAAALGDDLPPGDAAYNLGNTLAHAQDLEGALKAYRHALRANPSHDDARTNYELVSKLLQEQQGQDQNQENQNQEGESENQEGQESGAPPDSSGEQQNQPQQDSGEQDQDQQQQPSPPDSSAAADSSQAQPQGDPGQEQPEQQEPRDPDKLLSPEEARRLLDQLTPSERDLIQQRLRGTPRKKAEKDW